MATIPFPFTSRNYFSCRGHSLSRSLRAIDGLVATGISDQFNAQPLLQGTGRNNETWRKWALVRGLYGHSEDTLQPAIQVPIEALHLPKCQLHSSIQDSVSNSKKNVIIMAYGILHGGENLQMQYDFRSARVIAQITKMQQPDVNCKRRLNKSWEMQQTDVNKANVSCTSGLSTESQVHYLSLGERNRGLVIVIKAVPPAWLTDYCT